MPLQEEEIQVLVREVLKRLGSDSQHATGSVCSGNGVHPTVESAVRSAGESQILFQEKGFEFRRNLIAAIRKAGFENAERLAKMAHEETGLGRWEDKSKKNVLVSLKTPGPEDLQPVQAYTGDQGLTLIESAPFGVVASVTPSTNPTATIINNTISILSAGNAVVFAPHPAAKKCCQETIRVLDQAICASGGPHGLVSTFEPVSEENTLNLLKHPGVHLNMVTGGPGIVKAAMSLGVIRKTICAGPGNPPVIVDETADVPSAARGIVDGASFDNCVLCTGEKEVIVVQAIADSLVSCLRKDARAQELTREQMDALAQKVFKVAGDGKGPVLNREFVGKNASVIARALGMEISDSIRLLWGEVPNDHAFVWIEQLMPVLPITRVPDFRAAVDLAKRAEGGNHHTASIYSLHVGNITQAARGLACSIFVKNGPNYMGLGMGEGFATMTIGTPTGDGLTKPSHFCRPLHCSLVGYLRIV
ncbi:MAG: aldehyde dehydrogenase EutE [Elusimicrobia bacterium]|nr:aldehyde dehydrogenase EutE [Elusimicrobiota bacterium]